jgi:TonB family protein
VAAQSVPKCAATTDSIARPCELDAWPARTRYELPRYPQIFREAGYRGEARVEFVVDTSGNPLRSSLRIRASHELFATMVRNAFPLQRFEPPRRKGSPVNVQIVELVEFRHPGSNRYDASRRPAEINGVDSTGMLRTSVEAYVLYDSAAAPRLTEEDRWTIYAGVSNHLIQRQEKKPSAFSIQANGQPPPAEFFARWAKQDRVVPVNDCPRTYWSWVHTPDAPRAPPGWVDPVSIYLAALRPWALDLVILDVSVGQGGGTRFYLCEITRTAAGWKPDCILTGMAVS